jgi:NADPH2:quinone reductase
MRAIQFSEFGEPSKLQVIERPDPVARPDRAVVEVKAASINLSDVKNVAGAMEDTTLPRIPGRDFSGVVIDGPPEWMRVEVWGTGGDLGFTVDGTHATHIVVPVPALVRKPKNLTHEQAGSIGVTFVVGWLGAVSYGQIRSGETIGIIGANGGVGGAVAQIAKAKGLRVIGIDRAAPPPESPAAKLIDDFILSTNADIGAEMRRVTNGKGADIVFDSVGGILFESALKCAGHRGRLVEISATGKRRVDFDLIDFYHQEQVILGADSRKLDVTASAKFMADLVPGFESGEYLPPLIAARYSLDRAVIAYEAVAKGTTGRVVLHPS